MWRFQLIPQTDLICRGSGGFSYDPVECPLGELWVRALAKLCTGIENGDGRVSPSAAKQVLMRVFLKKTKHVLALLFEESMSHQ